MSGKRSLNRKSPKRESIRKPGVPRPLNLKVDEEISSGDDEDVAASDDDDSDTEFLESVEQKRQRLAKAYLMSVNEDVSLVDPDKDDDGDYEAVSHHLSRERLRKQGKLLRNLAVDSSFSADKIASSTTFLSGHKLSVTCVATTKDSILISGSKDNSVILWDLETGQKRFLRDCWSRNSHHSKQCIDGEVLAVSISTDGRYAVSGGRDNIIRIFDSRQRAAQIKEFHGHRDAISSLSFKRDSYSLYSGSFDRSIKHWDLNDMGYIETMFGHQDTVLSVDCWLRDRPLSSSADRSIRYWKVAEESHLVFRGHKASVDSVQILTDDTFVSGSQDGSLCLWKETQKRPIAMVEAAHGFESATNARWICSIASVKMSNFVVSGSYDGYLRLWNIDQEERIFNEVSTIPMKGVVNAMVITESHHLIAGLGREHRLGRWFSLKGNRNKIAVVPLRLNQQ